MRKKRQSSQQFYLALLGPKRVKAVHKTLVKMTPDVLIATYEILPTFSCFFHIEKNRFE